MPPQVVGPHGYKSLQKQLNKKKRHKQIPICKEIFPISVKCRSASHAHQMHDSHDSHHKTLHMYICSVLNCNITVILIAKGNK